MKESDKFILAEVFRFRWITLEAGQDPSNILADAFTKVRTATCHAQESSASRIMADHLNITRMLSVIE